MTARAGVVQAARKALATHDELQRVRAIGDSFRLGPDGLPIDAAGWLAWREQQSKPAYEAWSTAMDHLATVTGDEFPGRHPFSFRPWCEAVIAEAGHQQ